MLLDFAVAQAIVEDIVRNEFAPPTGRRTRSASRGRLAVTSPAPRARDRTVGHRLGVARLPLDRLRARYGAR